MVGDGCCLNKRRLCQFACPLVHALGQYARPSPVWQVARDIRMSYHRIGRAVVPEIGLMLLDLTPSELKVNLQIILEGKAS